MNKAREATKLLVRSLFKDDYGRPFELVDGQADIFNLIWTKKYPRNQIIGATQYGKSDTISMAVLLRSFTYKEPFAIIAGAKDKAQIIMSRVIQHIFDNEMFYSAIELDDNMPLDRLRRERSKDHITFSGGGSIRTFTANTKNKNATKEALTGFGSPNIIQDEASLVPDDVQAMVLRMLGGHKENFLLKIGNPFYRNHFLKTWESGKYHKILIDYHQAIAEGRYSLEFIEEMRDMPFFDILYECKFPKEEEYLDGGWRKLITDDLLNSAYITEQEAIEQGLLAGKPKLGADFAGSGNDRSAYVIRYPKVARLLQANNIKDIMQQVPIVEDYINEFELEERDVGIDYGGLGQGVGDRLRERDVEVNCIMFGQKAPSSDIYKNMRAFMYYELFSWLKNGGKIIKDDSFIELGSIYFKEDSERKFQIMPKEDLKKIMREKGLTVSSPDVADALALTFADNTDLADESDIEFV